MSKLHIKTGDTVILLTGDKKDRKDKNGKAKTGKVLEVSPKEGKVIVEGVAMVKKHQKARAQGQESKIVNIEAAIDASNVLRICPSCKKAAQQNKSIPVKRVIEKLDSHFATNDLKSAQDLLEYWQKEAKTLQVYRLVSSDKSSKARASPRS